MEISAPCGDSARSKLYAGHVVAPAVCTRFENICSVKWCVTVRFGYLWMRSFATIKYNTNTLEVRISFVWCFKNDYSAILVNDIVSNIMQWVLVRLIKWDTISFVIYVSIK